MRDEPGANRILDDVPRNRLGIFSGSKDSVVIALLP